MAFSESLLSTLGIDWGRARTVGNTATKEKKAAMVEERQRIAENVVKRSRSSV